MTFIQPSKKSIVFRLFLVLIVAGLIGGTFWLIMLYNQTVNLNHEIAAAKSELDSIGAENTALNNQIITMLGNTDPDRDRHARRSRHGEAPICKRRASRTIGYSYEEMKNRTLPLIIGVIAAYGFLLFRVSELQLAKNGYYTARAASEQSASAASALNRGAIYFTKSDGSTLPVAIDQDFPTIYAVPTEIADAAEAANTLAPVLNMPVDTLQALLSKPHDDYELLVAEGRSLRSRAQFPASIWLGSMLKKNRRAIIR